VADLAELPLDRGKKAEKSAVDGKVVGMYHGAENACMNCEMRFGLALGSMETCPGAGMAAVRTSPEPDVGRKLHAAVLERTGSGTELGTLDMGCGSGSSGLAPGLPMGCHDGCWTPCLRCLRSSRMCFKRVIRAFFRGSGRRNKDS
jgi:hypothetical protein